MDKLPAFGRLIHQVVLPTYQTYVPILATNSAELINSTKRETFAYGDDPRQQLDVYKPSSIALHRFGQGPRPIFMFVYGGGFINGDRINPNAPGGLVYKNLGYFFAENLGYDTIVMDYRLVKHGAKFPSGGEDVGAALKWIETKYGSSSAGRERKIFVLGNSAGGVHLNTWIYGDQFQQDRIGLTKGSNGVRLAGVVSLGTAFHFDVAGPPLKEILNQYFGANFAELTPISLLKKAGKQAGSLPSLLVLDSELDPKEIIQSGEDFVQELQTLGIEVEYRHLPGHNHISPPLALGTGITQEEKWGYQVGDWCKNCK